MLKTGKCATSKMTAAKQDQSSPDRPSERMWQHIVALASEHNAHRCRIHWLFTCADARSQMQDLYPSPKFELD